MRWCAVRLVTFALACSVFCGAAQAALVLTAPEQVGPGASFEVTLSLNEALTLNEPEVLDTLDVLLTYDSSVLGFVAPPTAGTLLADPNVDAQLGEVSFALFLSGPSTFGPGELIRYRFNVLPGVQNATATISASAEPAVLIDFEGNRRKLTDWAPATAAVQVVPEPSSWASLAAGLGCLMLLRARRLRIARTEPHPEAP